MGFDGIRAFVLVCVGGLRFFIRFINSCLYSLVGSIGSGLYWCLLSSCVSASSIYFFVSIIVVLPPLSAGIIVMFLLFFSVVMAILSFLGRFLWVSICPLLWRKLSIYIYTVILIAF